MITREELREKAVDFELNDADIQRDYAFGWLISSIFQTTRLGETAVLKGGNALRKGYFPATRFSDDLDFSVDRGLDGDDVLSQLNESCQFAESASGIRFDLNRNRIADVHEIDATRQVYKYRLYFKDMLVDRDHIDISIRMDITEYDRLALPAQERRLIHPYSDVDDCSTSIRCVKLEEALADKLKCLLQRRYCYDLFDVVYGTFISKEIAVDTTELMRVFLQKTIFSPSPLAAKQLLLDLPLDVFRGYWGKVIVPAASRLSFDGAVAQLRSGIEELFAPLPAGQSMAYAFYPSHLRNPILQAASDRKLLKLHYHGRTRLVEPYALIFKRRVRSDNAGHEYFYAYDTTGGHSGPGIKSFFAHDVRGIEVTDIDFEPRYEIHLAKAGDSAMSGHFRGTPGPRRSIGRSTKGRASSYYDGPRYIVECSYCGKQFKRKKRSTTINKHKDPYGNQCFGRRGYLVDHVY